MLRRRGLAKVCANLRHLFPKLKSNMKGGFQSVYAPEKLQSFSS